MAVILSERAATKVKEILSKKGLPSTAGLRLPAKGDQVFVSNGARIVVDKKSYLYLNGVVIDWQEQAFGHSFTYTNPNAKGVCGCGTSFSV
jgi:iron-sulfur cluster assembly protein